MRRLIKYLSAVILCIACNEQSNKPFNTSAHGSGRFSPTASKPLKPETKTGIVLPLDNDGFIERPKVVIWSDHSFPRDSMYSLQFAEQVMIRGEHGDYFYLSPARDTTVTGYLLKGWIILDSANKDGLSKQSFAVRRVNSVTRKEIATNALEQKEMLSLSYLLSKYYTKEDDMIQFDEPVAIPDLIGLAPDTVITR